MKLTGTNSSIGLIGRMRRQLLKLLTEHFLRSIYFKTVVAEWLGGYGEGPTPDPIPNSAVKTLSADGTAS